MSWIRWDGQHDSPGHLTCASLLSAFCLSVLPIIRTDVVVNPFIRPSCIAWWNQESSTSAPLGNRQLFLRRELGRKVGSRLKIFSPVQEAAVALQRTNPQRKPRLFSYFLIFKMDEKSTILPLKWPDLELQLAKISSFLYKMKMLCLHTFLPAT